LRVLIGLRTSINVKHLPSNLFYLLLQALGHRVADLLTSLLEALL